MTRVIRTAVVALAVLATLSLSAAPAAARPAHAGPPMVETAPLADDPEAPFFVCNGQTLRFSGGTVTFRFKDLPRERGIGIITFRNAQVTADDGRVYRAQGSGMFRAGAEEGSFRLNLTFTGHGRALRVHTVATFTETGETVVERGNCRTELPEEL
jgi:hypothetical protein